MFHDASAANYGRGQTLNHWLNYLRVVDYISAACVVFRKELFLQLGGLDSRVCLVERVCMLLSSSRPRWVIPPESIKPFALRVLLLCLQYDRGYYEGKLFRQL